MKLRFRLRSLLCVPLIVGVVWWWVTWPERTARQFVDLLDQGDEVAARAMMVEKAANQKPAENDDHQRALFNVGDLTNQNNISFTLSAKRSRTFADKLKASGEFTICAKSNSEREELHFGSFSVVRGRIRLFASSSTEQLAVIYKLQSTTDEVLKRLRHDSPPNATMQIVETLNGGFMVLSSEQGHDELQALISEVKQQGLAKAPVP